MNNLLQLKGNFEQVQNRSSPGANNLPAKQSVSTLQLEMLRNALMELKKFWSKESIFTGALVSVYYNKIAAKSNRIRGLLSIRNTSANSSIVGAKFTNDESPKHIITHYVSKEVINESISRLNICIKILNEKFDGLIDQHMIEKINSKNIIFDSSEIAKTNFVNVIVDSFYVKKFDVLVDEQDFKNESIITIYKTDVPTAEVMERLGIHLPFTRIMDDTTILLMPNELLLLKQKAPYLISMAVSDITQLTKTDFVDIFKNKTITIPSPKNEPIIGVIDTMFSETVYFSEWVEFKNMLSEEIPLSQDDYNHGTAVSSIIVDGPASNPDMDDGCGRFRVRHFGVASGTRFSSFTILRSINEIIASNKDIKVWNLSLGAKFEINLNFISPEAAILDRIQYENDVIFIIAGTNKDINEKQSKLIGSPADSINSLVVNSVNFNGKPASYTRTGPVLSFFTKPDVSYYGGDENKPVRVCTPTGEKFVKGTSFAAPWIARKVSYLINVLGLSREVAKALIINAATTWDKQKIDSTLSGHGVVPVRIDDIVNCPKDEIRFILSGISEKYDTYNYNIPVPVIKDKHPFVTKVTLCYFPSCSRNQGVDYTNTELDISFGRLNEKTKGKIQSINNNYQTEENKCFEKDARKLFRKWDNVKHIREVYTGKTRAKKVFSSGLWGVSIKTKERLEKKHGIDIKFGIVVALKEIDGINRIDDFIKNCALRGWLVNKIDIKNRVEIYNMAEEEIDFDNLI